MRACKNFVVNRLVAGMIWEKQTHREAMRIKQQHRQLLSTNNSIFTHRCRMRCCCCCMRNTRNELKGWRFSNFSVFHDGTFAMLPTKRKKWHYFFIFHTVYVHTLRCGHNCYRQRIKRGIFTSFRLFHFPSHIYFPFFMYFSNRWNIHMKRVKEWINDFCTSPDSPIEPMLKYSNV